MNELTEQIIEQSAKSYPDMFRRRVNQSPDRVAFYCPSYTEPENWYTLTYAQAKEKVDVLAAAFIALGLETEQRIAIACSTRIEWVLLDLGASCARGVTTTIYPSMKPHDEAHILMDCGAVIAVVENYEQLQKIQHHPTLDTQLAHIILIDDDRTPDAPIDARVLTYDQLNQLGANYLKTHPSCVDDSVATITRDQLSTLIYTSGTTGFPKGVEITHGSWTYEGAAIVHLDFVDENDILYLWLPLTHVFGRDLLCAQFSAGFSSAVDGRVNRIVQGVGEVQPTLLVGVPRIFEKVRAAVITMNPQRGIKGRISRWAFAVGRDARPYRLAGRRKPPFLALRHAIADRIVFRKLRNRLGGRIRLLVSGSAKLSPQIQEWFYSAGLHLIEGYGLSETSAIAAVNNPPQPPAFGTVGKVMPGIECKIADDGEILFRGPIVARGYHNLPEESAETFVDGWFHTGDIGVIDDEGYLTITDRKKDLLKTSNGKYVAPQKVENALMANNPYASQTIVIGEGRKFVSALIILDKDSLAAWAKRKGRTDASYAEITQLPEIRRSIDRRVQRANRRLERHETIKRYVILDRELTLESGELTPSLKVRRDIVMEHFADTIEEIYADDSAIPFVAEKEDEEGKRSRHD